MYHHVFTERQKSRRNKTIIEKKATIIVKKKRQHAITSLSHRCHGFQVLVLPSPQDRAPAPIHALHSPYHLACIRLVPYDYPTHATTTTKYRAQASQSRSICRSPAIACDAKLMSRPCSYSACGSKKGSERSPVQP